MNYVRSQIRRLLDWVGERLEIDLDDLGDEELRCKGRNSNVCVAEGCYGEACRSL